MRQGRTDAWIAHQLDVSVGDIRGFKREHGLAPADTSDEGDVTAAAIELDEPDLRAEDEALVAAALEAEAEADAVEDEPSDALEDEGDSDEDKKQPRRRGRRGGRGRRKTGGKSRELEGTFDHGEEGYGLWLDPAVQDDPVYAEHWAGHRPVVVSVEAERIVITRAGENGSSDDDE